ncbi:Uncharacterized protein K02A2.6 [Stylophora pistillata]|uniref:Uncharacterized protein K02A2.6 n=1 Tax=Stylophora pistillata TaxID=50429 RepID=A0A2B4R4X9_STYPI|nr:Uncharacterized protein K02A2.6 [Stylophora pistillata]
MNQVKILDGDVNATHDERIDVPSNVRSDPILSEFTDVFTGIGCLEGTYSIQADEGFRPVVHPPRKVPVPLLDTLKLELDNMVKSGILAKLIELTSWVSSLVIVKKSNGKIRVCLDLRDLNRAVKRSLYPLPTIAEVATRLSGANVFSVLDAKCGFWQVQLDERSSYLTTVNTPPAPVLQYFDVSKNVTIQCDASQYGIGATLLQEGQPVHYANRALTSTEQNYAQIEKELLAVLFSCEHFEHYIYGKHVTVETDHKPLIAIQKKPINTASKRLQRMMLRLQRFDLNLTYKPGKEMYIADALSRVLPRQSKIPNASTSSYYKDLETVNFAEDLSISESTLAKFQVETVKDESLQALSQVIHAGWPTKTSMVPTSAQLFFKCRDEMTLQNGLVFKGTSIVVPESLHRDMIEETHKSRQGLQACLRRAREVFFWPGMSAQLKNRIDKCSICQSVRPEQASEPLQPHPVPERPWQRVETDLFTFENRNYLVLVDYYSNFIELDHLANTSSQTVINKLKMHFSRHGAPDYVVSDNDPQYSSSEFRRFAATRKFTHVTTSPHYPQANGMAEKSLLKTDQTVSDLLKRDRVKQANNFDQHAKPLSEFKSGDKVRMKMPGETKWSKAVVSSKVASHSCKVEVNGRFYRRNRRQLRSTTELFQETPFKMDEDDLTVPDNLQEQNHPPRASSQVETYTSPPRSQLPPTPQTTELSARPPQEATTTEIRIRHRRLIKPPKKFDIES